MVVAESVAYLGCCGCLLFVPLVTLLDEQSDPVGFPRVSPSLVRQSKSDEDRQFLVSWTCLSLFPRGACEVVSQARS